jgi:hypothetical protein
VGPAVELQPDAPVVPEDGEAVPAAEVRAAHGPHDAGARAAVEPESRVTRLGDCLHW